MKIKKEIKDWQIAQSMFGKNTKQQCKIVSKLRKNGIVEPLCEGYSIIRDKNLIEDSGWIISNEFLE